MINLILVAHGHFASGIKTSLELIAGKQEKLHTVDFVADMSADELTIQLLHAIEEDAQTLILCDLLGGTPFKVASTLMLNQPEKIRVLSGLNLSMLLEACFTRTVSSLEEVAEKALQAGQTGIVSARKLFDDTVSEETIDDGI